MSFEELSDWELFKEAVERAGDGTDQAVADALGFISRTQVGRNRKKKKDLRLQSHTRASLERWLKDHPAEKTSDYERGLLHALSEIVQAVDKVAGNAFGDDTKRFSGLKKYLDMIDEAEAAATSESQDVASIQREKARKIVPSLSDS